MALVKEKSRQTAEVEWSESILQAAITDHFRDRILVAVPNTGSSFPYDAEADLLIVTKSELLWECEIKISRSDFFKEFRNINNRKASNQKWLKHKRYASGARTCPNRYYVVAPKGVVDADLLPEYAGLIEARAGTKYFHQDRWIREPRVVLREVKQAKLIHSKKVHKSRIEELWRYISMRFWKESHKRNGLKGW